MAILNTQQLMKQLPDTLVTVASQHRDSGETVVRTIDNLGGKAPAGHVLGRRKGEDPVRVLMEASPNKPSNGIEVILQDDKGTFHSVPYGVPAEGFHGPKGSFDGVNHLASNMVDDFFFPASEATRHTEKVKAVLVRNQKAAYFFRPGESTAQRVELQGTAGWNGKDYATDLVRQAKAHGFPGLENL